MINNKVSKDYLPILFCVIFLLIGGISVHSFSPVNDDWGNSNSHKNEVFEFENTVCNIVFEDDFENGFGNWMPTGPDAGHIVSANSPNGNASFFVQDDDDELESSIISPFFDLTDVEDFSIEFNYRPIGMEGSKFFYLEISTDGNNFITLDEWIYGVDFYNGIVYNEILFLDNTYGDVMAQFRITGNGSNNTDQIYLDDIKIETCSSMSCVDNILQNTNAIISESEHVQVEIESDGIVPAGNTIDFVAGNSILLTNGFEVENGAIFHAYIEACDSSDPVDPDPPVDPEPEPDPDPPVDCSEEISGLPNSSAFAVPTFHSIGLYWSPSGGDSDRDVTVRFRECGTSEWQDGLHMLYNPVADASNTEEGAAYRGSLVHLTPATTYIIELSLENTGTTTTFAAETWSEEFPIDRVINLRNQTHDNQLTFDDDESGTPNGYTLIDGTGSTIDAGDRYGILLRNIEYVIIRGFTITNVNGDGIFLDQAKNIVIEDNEITKWGRWDELERFGHNLDSAIRSDNDDDAAVNIVIQRNKIHTPNHDSNNWDETNTKFLTIENWTGNPAHPNGSQAITLFRNVTGNHVIRYNEIYSEDPDIYFNDIMGAGQNASFQGFPGPDTDIYGNYISHCWDDAIEADGSNRNVRIWDNYITNTFVAVSNTPTSVGPIYVWRNVLGESRESPGSDFGYGLKCGFAGGITWMTGHTYFMHNTILQPDGLGYGGIGTRSGNRRINNMTAINNILHVNAECTNAISDNEAPPTVESFYDYNLHSKPIPVGNGPNSIDGLPTYQFSNQFNVGTMTGQFQPSANSNGVNAGFIIPNFTGSFSGSSPDIGAFESGAPDKVYGTQSTSGQ